jgi:hypothetical protein
VHGFLAHKDILMKVCSVEGCGRAVAKKGMCNSHYKKLRRTGFVHGKGRIAPGEARAVLENVVLPYDGEDCLIWPFSKKWSGHGQITIDQHVWSVNRYVCERVHGAPPTPRHEAAHECGKGHLGCCAPKHLTWKTHAENEADKIRHGTKLMGTRTAHAKLNDEIVAEARLLYAKMTINELCEKYGVTHVTMLNAVKGKTWKHVTAKTPRVHTHRLDRERQRCQSTGRYL